MSPTPEYFFTNTYLFDKAVKYGNVVAVRCVGTHSMELCVSACL